MNTSHYPSLELCKKLTDIGFPETTEFIIDDTKRIKKFSEVIVEYQGHYYDKIVRITKQGEYLCPSVMEMLDYMRENKISLLENGVINFLSPELPDSLAENILAYHNRIGHLNNYMINYNQ